MTCDYRQNVITNLRCCCKSYGLRRFTIMLNDLLLFQFFYMLGQTQFFVDNPVLFYNVNKLFEKVQLREVQKLIHHKIENRKHHYSCKPFLWQTEFSVMSRLGRMVTNIWRSHVSPSYPKRSPPQSIKYVGWKQHNFNRSIVGMHWEFGKGKLRLEPDPMQTISG
jgi:hypothetical protein